MDPGFEQRVFKARGTGFESFALAPTSVPVSAAWRSLGISRTTFYRYVTPDGREQ